jgi:hypothetical protein
MSATTAKVAASSAVKVASAAKTAAPGSACVSVNHRASAGRQNHSSAAVAVEVWRIA